MVLFNTLRRWSGRRAVVVGAAVGLALVASTVTAVRSAAPEREDGGDGAPSAVPVSFAAPLGTTHRPEAPATRPGGYLYRPRSFGRSTFTRLRDVPRAQLVAHLGINDRRQTTGTFIDADAAPDPNTGFATGHGFVEDRRGRTVRFDVPGASITLPNGINDRGDIVGASVDADADAAVHGFVRDRQGDIESFDVPFFRLHNVSDINERGQIVGYYDDPGFAGGGGFLRDRDGAITDIRYPGAAFTTVHGLNDHGQVVGAYLEPGAVPNADGTLPRGTVHGFVWEHGRFRSFDVPGSVFTQAFGINDRGDIVGGYRDKAGRQHGFLRDHRRYRTLDVPHRGGNIAYGINDQGVVVLPDARTASTLPVAP